MINMEQIPSFISFIERSVKENWNLDALTDYQGETLQYKDVARKIEKLHILFLEAGIKKGDKIALCGRNTSNWAVAFLSILTYGAVAVPILHEFKADQVHHIVDHSESRLLFVGDVVAKAIDASKMPCVEGIINIPDFSIFSATNQKLVSAREHLNELFGAKYPKNFASSHISYHSDSAEELALINYTSGTTGFSKGCMIPYRALWSNIDFAYRVLSPYMQKGDNMISMLPMSHMYGMAFEFLFEFTMGCHIYYLTRIPSPKVVFQAFNEIKPVCVISVPLIIEKIIKKQVLPKLQTPAMRIMLKMPIMGSKIKDKVRQKIVEAFGGRFYEVIIGGAAFNGEVEQFLKSIGFNFTVGYGATECAPIIGYSDWKEFKAGSCGKIAPRMEIKIVPDKDNPQYSESGEPIGEIVVRGANVMLGYYKNPEATTSTIIDGWYHTGDLGLIDAEGNIFIKGRSKNMLLGAAGQNIYPEEIEDKLNALPLVLESLVVQRGEALVALVVPDIDEAQKLGLSDDEIKGVMEENKKTLNGIVNNYEQIREIEVQSEEFEKTPKRSIRRYLYK